MTPFVPTSAEALRAAIASTIACSAQELQEAIGQVVVATVGELPQASSAGPEVRSLHDAATRTTVLLADRIPAGQEAQALAAEIGRHHGRQAAQAILGDRAAELLGVDGKMSNYRDPNQVYETGSDDTHWYSKVIRDGERFNVRVYDADGDRRPEREGSFADQVLSVAFADRSVLRLSTREVLKYTRSLEDSRGLHIEFGEPITPANFLAACNAAIDLAKVECSTQTAVAIVFEAQGVEVQVTETDSAEVQLALWERKLQGNGISDPKNVLGQVAEKPFYIWANEDCANKADSFKEAKAIRLTLFNDGGESVHIVDADGVEVVDAEIEAHEALVNAGFYAGARNPDVKPEFSGAFMVNDPLDPVGYAIVGDDIAALILEARDHLIDPAAEREVSNSTEVIVEYGVNELMPGGAGHNPFDANFDTQEQAEAAGLNYLVENPEVKSVVIFELNIEDNTIIKDETILSIGRSDPMVQAAILARKAADERKMSNCIEAPTDTNVVDAAAVYLLSELPLDDSLYGEDLPVACLFRVTAETMAKIDLVARMTNDGILSIDGGTVAMPHSDVVWLSRVGFTQENALASVPGFFDAEKDKVLYIGDAANMEIDGERADYAAVSHSYPIGSPDKGGFGLRVQHESRLGLVVSAKGYVKDIAMPGYMEVWSNLRDQIAPMLQTKLPLQNMEPTEGSQDYTVRFEVSISATSQEEAARLALDDLRDTSLGPWSADVVDSQGRVREVSAEQADPRDNYPTPGM